MGGLQTHTMLFGGSRSGKTFAIVRAYCVRAIKHPGARQAMLRFRFNHIRSTIVADTFPKVMSLCFPDVDWKLDKTEWVAKFQNGSEIWFGGLDDKERTEKILGQEHCVDPSSLVLTADLRWVRADSLLVGQELVAFPEELFGNQTLCRSVVERSEITQAERYLVVTDRGDTVVSAQHKFVRGTRGHNPLRWVMASQLAVGDRIKFATQPWQDHHGRDAGWLAGIIDGEGCLSLSEASPQVTISQNDGLVLDQIVSGLDRLNVGYRVFKQKLNGNAVKTRGIWQSLRLLGITRPFRLLPRAAGLWEGKRPFNGRDDDHFAVVEAIEPLGMGPVVALGTSSRTFIADGFLGHNCGIYLNECSQIPWSARNMAVTRLAQNVGARLRMDYDCNPPSQAHWTYKVFIKKADPDSGAKFPNPDNYQAMLLNPEDNKANLSEDYINELTNLPERLRKRFLRGEFLPAAENALWSTDLLDRQRLTTINLPEMQRVIIAVDPSGADEERPESDAIGIVVAGLGSDGIGYLLEDLTIHTSPGKWGNIVGTAFERHQADLVIGEDNFGGAMVQHVIQTARPNTPYKAVKASRGKVVRAEPIAALYEQNKVKHAGYFPDLEDELCAFTTSGYVGQSSPNRADALVWAMTELFPGMTNSTLKLDIPPPNVGRSWAA